MENLNPFVSGLILGRPGAGKTHLVNTLPSDTLLISAERPFGKALKNFTGTSVFVDCWKDARDLACLIGGEKKDGYKNPKYGKEHFDSAQKRFKHLDLEAVNHLYFDSLTSFSKLCADYNRNNLFTHNGIDFRNVFNHSNVDLYGWIAQILRSKKRSVWLCCSILDSTDEYNQQNFTPVIESGKIISETMTLVDEVFVISVSENGDRSLTTKNIWVPSKDRSGSLKETEEANLMGVLEKIFHKEKQNEQYDSSPSIQEETLSLDCSPAE